MTDEVISQLQSIAGLKIECPSCGCEFPFKRARAFNMYAEYPPSVDQILLLRKTLALQQRAELKLRRKLLAEDRRKRPDRISVTAEATNFGQIGEQILPALETFPYKQDECRVLFKPVDYVVFVGLSACARVEEIRFVEAKTGGGALSPGQRQIRDRVGERKVSHKVIG